MWTHRNGFKHGPDGPDHQRLKQELHDDIHDEYNLGTATLLPRNQHWLSKPIDTILSLNIATQQQWLISITNAREKYHHQPTADPQLEQQRTLLQNWLHNT